MVYMPGVEIPGKLMLKVPVSAAIGKLLME